jgi:Subtilisin inhibitor-like
MKLATSNWARGPRLRAIAASSLIAITGSVAIAACGTTPAPGTGAAAKPKVSLRVTEMSTAGKATKHWTLSCDPTGGAHANAAACKALLGIKDPFAKPAAGTMCPMILANQPSYVITGTWHGQHVSKTVLDGACDGALWNKLHKLMF